MDLLNEKIWTMLKLIRIGTKKQVRRYYFQLELSGEIHDVVRYLEALLETGELSF